MRVPLHVVPSAAMIEDPSSSSRILSCAMSDIMLSVFPSPMRSARIPP